MSLIENIIRGKAHIGQFNYDLIAVLDRFITFCNDHHRLKKQHYEYPNVKITKDLYYSEKHSKFHMLDIYTTEEDITKKQPVIIDIHGGGLVYGRKELNHNFICELTTRGYKVVAMSYHLAPSFNFLQQLEDVFDCFNWIECNGDKYGFDLEHMNLCGDSAGGYLSLCSSVLFLNPELAKSVGVKVPSYSFRTLGLVSTMAKIQRDDFLALPYKASIRKELKGNENLGFFCQVLNYLPVNLQPTYFCSTEMDIVKEDYYELEKVLKEKGIEYQSIFELENKKYKVEHVYPICYPKYEESQKFINGYIDFVNAHN